MNAAANAVHAVDSKATFFATRLNEMEQEIYNLPISRLDERQGLLVSLLVLICDHETDNGRETNPDDGATSQDYWNTLRAYTSSVGFKFLGAGHFSAAFGHDMLPGRIIKVGFKKEDSGAAYAAWCRMNQGRVGVPVLHAVARHASCYTVVMDKLEELPHSRSDWSSDNRTQFSIVRSQIYRIEYSGEIGYPVSTEYEMDLKQTADDIWRFFEGIASFDIHPGNVMLSKDGNMVITDPVSWTNEEVVSRDKFQCEVDELLAEIELHAQQAAIERCRERKAKRKVGGTFMLAKKAACKRRKANRKSALRNHRERMMVCAAYNQERRDEDAARLAMGTVHWQLAWFGKGLTVARKAEQEQAIQWRVADHIQIIKGRPLGIDKRLDARFLQG